MDSKRSDEADEFFFSIAHKLISGKGPAHNLRQSGATQRIREPDPLRWYFEKYGAIALRFEPAGPCWFRREGNDICHYITSSLNVPFELNKFRFELYLDNKYPDFIGVMMVDYLYGTK